MHATKRTARRTAAIWLLAIMMLSGTGLAVPWELGQTWPPGPRHMSGVEVVIATSCGDSYVSVGGGLKTGAATLIS